METPSQPLINRHAKAPVSEGLNSVETTEMTNINTVDIMVSEGLNSVETQISAVISSMSAKFQKDLIVWKLELKEQLLSEISKVSEGLNSVETEVM